jgi:predicted MPP superfamily phosphohydrolase
MWLYVSRGTGYWGPPIRLGAPSEITQIQLTRA